MNRVILLFCFSGMLMSCVYSQSIQTELRLLPGLASGTEMNPGDLGIGLYAGYEQAFSDHWAWRGGLEMSSTAWAGQLLAELGARRDLRIWDQSTLSARAGLHGGMIWFRENPPLMYGLSTGIRWQRKTDRWCWYISPGLRWLNAPGYGAIAPFSSLTDLEIRVGVNLSIAGVARN